jgi:predicted RNase H-like nuclease (RuvC/YqgF family)
VRRDSSCHRGRYFESCGHYDAMLLNEFLKEHQTVEELKKEIAALTATVKEQGSQIRKVNAELETTKSSSQMVLNNQ